MILIADSSSTRTEWAIVDGKNVVEQACTAGLNPYFLSRREISHIIRLHLPESFFHTKLEYVYFYGSGCANEDKIKIVSSSLIAQFKTPSEVNSDLLGAARGLLLHDEGIACILSTGANSCYYDGNEIVKNVRPGGYVLGDEGSNSYLGKLLVSDVLKELAPHEVIENFYKMFDTSADEILDLIYTNPTPNRTLADYSQFLAANIDVPYCRDLVYKSFLAFFERNILAYDYKRLPLSIVGRTGCTYRDLLDKAASDCGVKIRTIEQSSLPGLIKYHSW